jgi:hypothetical protein
MRSGDLAGMKIQLKTSGFDQLYAALNHAAERVSTSARKQMHRGADAIVKEARLNTPVDEHNLEESIKKDVNYGVRGRLQIQIVMGGFVNGVNVDEYAMEIHENYSQMGVGPGTIAKRLANPGRYVGEKFLERAVRDNEKKLTAAMILAVLREWRL